MSLRAHIAVAAVLLGCILFIFVSPAFNLPWTMLQGRQGLRLVMLVAIFVCAGLLLSGLRLMLCAWRFHLLPVLCSDSLIDITCTRRC